MKIQITYNVDDDAPLTMNVEADSPAQLYRMALSALSTMTAACLDRIQAKLSEEFLPDTGDARRK